MRSFAVSVTTITPVKSETASVWGAFDCEQNHVVRMPVTVEKLPDIENAVICFAPSTTEMSAVPTQLKMSVRVTSVDDNGRFVCTQPPLPPPVTVHVRR
jgi:hypothetical protein